VFAAAIAWRLLNAPITVQTVLVEAPEGADGGAVLNASGYVVARQLATVSSKVTGGSPKCCSKRARGERGPGAREARSVDRTGGARGRREQPRSRAA